MRTRLSEKTIFVLMVIFFAILIYLLWLIPNGIWDRIDEALSASPTTSMIVTTTWYTCRGIETDHDPNATASGYRCGDPIAAVSLDILKKAPFGSAIKVLGKYYIVGDTIPRKSLHVDLPTKYPRDAFKFGIKRGILMEVYLR